MGKRHKFNVAKLADLRTSKGMTHDEFGRAIGTTGRTIRNWEDGKTFPTTKDMDRICDKFDLDLAWFMSKRQSIPVA